MPQQRGPSSYASPIRREPGASVRDELALRSITGVPGFEWAPTTVPILVHVNRLAAITTLLQVAIRTSMPCDIISHAAVPGPHRSTPRPL